jgi:terminase small subunit / prophage DNA-packing protein
MVGQNTPEPGLLVNRKELSEILGVSLPTIDNYLSRGCPYVSKADRSKGIPWEFNTRDVINWAHEDFVSRSPDYFSLSDF